MNLNGYASGFVNKTNTLKTTFKNHTSYEKTLTTYYILRGITVHDVNVSQTLGYFTNNPKNGAFN